MSYEFDNFMVDLCGDRKAQIKERLKERVVNYLIKKMMKPKKIKSINDIVDEIISRIDNIEKMTITSQYGSVSFYDISILHIAKKSLTKPTKLSSKVNIEVYEGNCEFRYLNDDDKREAEQLKNKTDYTIEPGTRFSIKTFDTECKLFFRRL